MDTMEFVRFRIKVMIGLGLAVVGAIVLLYPTGYFGPLSSRIRGLFVKHTKTGNPLVDSVAEHQPANAGIYASYLNMPLDYAVVGGLVSLRNRNNGFWFLLLYAYIANHFSGKMSRLVLICAPICSIAAGIWCGFLLDAIIEPFLLFLGKKPGYTDNSLTNGEIKDSTTENGKDQKKENNGAANSKDGKKGGKAATKPAKPESNRSKKNKKVNPAKLEHELGEWETEFREGGAGQALRTAKEILFEMVPEDSYAQYKEMRVHLDNTPAGVSMRIGAAVFFVFYCYFVAGIPQRIGHFVQHCDHVAQSLSNPQVVYKAQTRGGKTIIVDDYLKGYQWVDANTPKDARVIAWWDYGYQITGIAKRTSIADGNTWNHEHIATLGRTLTSPEKKAHNAIRHWADYVLVWAGDGGDDLAKSPHLARIGNSVFPDHCGDDDPKCHKFSFYGDGTPTPMMERSLLYKLVKHNVAPGVKADKRLFEEVHTTQHGLMRVYKVHNVSQETKEWIADPANRVCDAPGSWYCVGQYPPALHGLIAQRRNFAQLEDFNRKGGEQSAYAKMINREQSGEL